MAQTSHAHPSPRAAHGRFAPRAEEPPASEAPETDQERAARALREENETRAVAEAATAHLPKQGEARSRPLTPAEVAEEGEPMVKMLFPKPVTVTLAGYRMVHFPMGSNDVPASLSVHPYIRASGALVR